MKSNSLWCPECGRKTLNFYDKDGTRPDLVDKIHHLWCMACGRTMDGTPKTSEVKDE